MPTEEVVAWRNQILGMRFGMRSLSYLLEERKLQVCGLVRENKSTDDWLIVKYVKWDSVPVPRRYLSPSERPSEFNSPNKAPKRSRAEDEGIMTQMLDMYSPTLLNTQPSQLVSFPRYPDHNFFIWANPDLIVHRFDKGRRSFQINYSTEEYMERAFNQYSTNELKDLSHVDASVDDLPPAIPLAEHGPDHCPRSQSPS